MNKVELQNFFIFNSSYGSKECDEYEKILYYYPETDSIDTKMKNVGLVQAVLQFSSTFKPNKPVNSIHTQKRRQLFYEPEENFWIIMTVEIPHVVKLKDNSNCIEYQEEDVQDSVYESVLQQSYYMFRLFNGTFEYNSKNLIEFRNKTEQFFSEHLASLKLSHCDILNIFNGIQFLPLDKETFINVQCFINMLENNYSVIKYTTFLYNEHLVWSGLEPQDMQIVYQYLITKLIPREVNLELSGGSIPRNSTPFTALHHGRFITGPTDLKNSDDIDNIPKIYVCRDSEACWVYMVVYRALSSSVCMFLDATTKLSLELFQEIDKFITPNLIPVVSDIAEYCAKQVLTPVTNQNEIAPKFIYFNKLNLAYKSTVHLDNKQTGNLSCNKDLVKIMTHMRDNQCLKHPVGESVVKTMNDYWVVAKFSNSREFYVVLQQKNSSLIEISDEVSKLCESELKGIFFHNI